MKTKLSNITIVLTITSVFFLTGCSRSRASEDKPAAGDELATLKREYADVLALQGTSRGEILAIARILRANPEMALDRTAASGEYCFKSGPGTMIHFAAKPEGTSEDVVYELDASGFDRSGPGPGAHETATRTTANDPWLVVFPSKRAAGPASRTCDACSHNRDCCQRQMI
jgi:hypothetical protein